MSEYLLTLKEQGASKASKYGAYILDAVSPDPSTTTGPLPADTPVGPPPSRHSPSRAPSIWNAPRAGAHLLLAV